MDGCGVREGGGAGHALLPLTNSGAVPTVFVVKVICRRDSHQTMTGLYGKQQEHGGQSCQHKVPSVYDAL